MSETRTDRDSFVLSLFDQTGVGLEISPSYNPLLPKKSGYRVETVDYANAEELREKYRNDGLVDISRIEDVDFVSDGACIADVIGKIDFYDYVVASHVIEHVPDLLGFLRNCERLLKPDGVLVLVVPDKRFCFDVLQPLSGPGEVLQAHVDKRTRHSPGKLFDFIGYRAMRGNAIAWDSNSDAPLSFEFGLGQAKELFEAAQQSDAYHDIHAWRFTPSSFRLMVRDLNEIGALHLREVLFHDTIGFEFYIVLSKSGAGCPVDRLSLARAVLEEQKAIAFGSL